MRLFLFNPENDLALAANVDSYTAPPIVRRLRSDLAVLPLWIASAEGLLLAEPSAARRRFVEEAAGRYGLPAMGFWTGGAASGVEAEPWGWSRAAVEEYKRQGVDAGLTRADLDAFRLFSHRSSSVAVMRWLRGRLPEADLPDEPVVCEEISAVEEAVGMFGEAVLKMPWSSSGRGVCRVSHADFGHYRPWAEGIIRRQGAVVVERKLDAVQDFALEYRAERGKARHCGYSVFFNTPQMSYDRAVVASSAALRGELEAWFPPGGLERLQLAMAECLSELLPAAYSGHVGVDMMAYRKADGAVAVNPCVEVNLRSTMGVVSAALGDRVVAPGKMAEMRVACHKTPAAAKAFAASLGKPIVESRRLVSGTQLLAPVGDASLFTATLTVTK